MAHPILRAIRGIPAPRTAVAACCRSERLRRRSSLGAGAAGLMCAHRGGQARTARRGARAQDRVGKKIAISGGGRCNFTNLGAGPDNYLSEQPEFCKSALARYTPWDFVALVEKHRIAVSREKTRPAVLRRQLARDHRDAARRMRRGGRGNPCDCNCRVIEEAERALSPRHEHRTARERLARRRDRRAVVSQSSARPISAIAWRGNSACDSPAAPGPGAAHLRRMRISRRWST